MKKNVIKKLTVSLLLMVMMMSIFAIPAMAATDYSMITLDDSADFTVVKSYLQTEAMTVKGLDASYVKQSLGADEQYVTWTTSDPFVVRFKDGNTYPSSVSGEDTVTVQTLFPGTATITATYDTPSADPVTVTSYVVVEGYSTTSSVSNIDVSVDFTADAVDADSNDMDDFSDTYTVPLFDLTDAGIANNDNDVLKKTPTALHALLYAVEIQFSSETTSTPIGSFDWDWVIDNVSLISEAGYLEGVGSDNSSDDWSRGWQFEINDVDPGHSASASPLSSNDVVDWAFDTWE